MLSGRFVVQTYEINAEVEEKRREEENIAWEERGEKVEEKETRIKELKKRRFDIINAMAKGADNRLPDIYVTEMLKQYLKSNQFQNQGYVLVNYPKTADQVW